MPVFRRPTFQTPVRVWKLQPDLISWMEEAESLVGQIYTAKRSPDDDEKSSTFFVYPPESDLLRDAIDYGSVGNSDVVVVSFPTLAPRQVGYRVREVQPRWLGFGNEHLMATLEKLTPAELATVTDTPPPPPPPLNVPNGMSVDLYSSALTGSCAACNEIADIQQLVLVNPGDANPRWQLDVPCTCYTAGFIRLVVEYVPSLDLVNVTLTDTFLVSTVEQWQTTVENWNMVSPLTCDIVTHGDSQCDWPESVIVS